MLRIKPRLPINELNQLTFNVGGLAKKIEEIHLAILQANYLIEVIHLQETMEDDTIIFKIPGYKCYEKTYKNRQANRRGVSTYVCDLETMDLQILSEEMNTSNLLKEIIKSGKIFWHP